MDLIGDETKTELQLQIAELKALLQRARQTAASNAKAHNRVEDERFALACEVRRLNALLKRKTP